MLFVDVAEIGGRDRLITYERGRLRWFDPESATERPLVDVAAGYNASVHGLHYAGAEAAGPVDEGEIPRIDITRDLNGDGREDIILPDIDGFSTFLQRTDGTFTDPAKLGPPEPFRDEVAFGDKRSYGEAGLTPLTIPWYLSCVHQMDHDRDGRSDLVFWNEDHFEVHHQNAGGLFDSVPESFAIDVPFDSDGTYSLIFGFSDVSAFRLAVGLRKSTRHTVLDSLRDLNGDGVADLVVGRVKTGVSKMLRALVGRSLTMEFELFRNDGGAYPARADAIRKVRTAFDPTGGRNAGFFPAALGGDVNGDGRSDLLVTKSRKELHVFLGVPGSGLLTEVPQKVAIALPGDERNSWLVDLDRDGKQDLLMHHPSAAGPHRLTVLMAR